MFDDVPRIYLSPEFDGQSNEWNMLRSGDFSRLAFMATLHAVVGDVSFDLGMECRLKYCPRVAVYGYTMPKESVNRTCAFVLKSQKAISI